MRARFFTRLAAFVLITVCFAATANAASITVSAAASLTNAFGEVKEAFEKKYPDVKVTTNFAASNPLLRQIEEGAPVDVFASADQATMDKAAEKQLIDNASRANFALNSLVLIVPADSKAPLTKVEDLKEGAITKIAIGNPASVPAGRYGKDALTKAGLWDTLEKKYIMGESVRQTLAYVVRGEVEAGIVYMTDAKQGGDKVRIVTELSGHDPVLYPIAVIKKSAAQKEAKMFIDFVLSDEGKTILAKYGFSKP